MCSQGKASLSHRKTDTEIVAGKVHRCEHMAEFQRIINFTVSPWTLGVIK